MLRMDKGKAMFLGIDKADGRINKKPCVCIHKSIPTMSQHPQRLEETLRLRDRIGFSQQIPTVYPVA